MIFDHTRVATGRQLAAAGSRHPALVCHEPSNMKCVRHSHSLFTDVREASARCPFHGGRASNSGDTWDFRVPQDKSPELKNIPNRHSLEAYAQRWMRLGNIDRLSIYNPFFTPIDTVAAQMRSKGEKLVSFAHYDYLGLSRHPEVAAAAHAAIDEVGTGVGASRLVGGERAAHRLFEREMADFLGVGDAMALVSGYATNVTLLGHLLAGGDLIIIDELSHNSIVSGSDLSRAETLTFPHNDMDALEAILKERRSEFGRVLIVIEGLYSMDGDIPDLPRALEIRDKYNAWLMVDEAHSIGVLGERGRGVAEHYGIDPARLDLIIGTLSKSFVSSGGFIAANKAVIEWLRFTLPGFVYSVGLAPPVTATARAALAILRREPERLEKMRDITSYFVRRARESGLDVGDAIGAAVVPLMCPDTFKTILLSRSLMERGFYVPPIVQLGVPKNKPRLRFFFSASHERADVDAVVAAIVEALTEEHAEPAAMFARG